MHFISPSKGVLSLEEVCIDILKHMEKEPNYKYKLIVGTDSYQRDEVCFVTAIIMHRVGKGAVYYYRKKREQVAYGLKQRIFLEASISLEVASLVQDLLFTLGSHFFDIEIHVDVGNAGDTKAIIKEVVGMIVGSGFSAKIKPNSYGASKVSDKYTR